MNSFLARNGLLRVSGAARVIMAITLVAVGSLLSACGGGGGGGTQPPPTPTVSSITVGPASATVAAGLTLQFTATALYSDGTQKDVSQSATWASSATSFATVSATGLATGLAAGTSSVSATFGGVTGNDTLTVKPPNVSSITVGPAGASVAAGLTLQFKATAAYSDGSQKDVSQSATWVSSNTAKATVSAAGLATGLIVGTSSISATLSGVTGSDTLTVGPPNLVSLIVSPNKPNVAAGKKLQFSALGNYTDHSTQDLTQSVAWSSSSTATATISTASGSVGLATALALGTTEINASSGTVAAAPVTMTVTATIYAYATNFDDNTVSQYVLGSGGSLAPLAAPTVPAGQHPFSISVEPTGEYVYVSNWGSSSVSQYRIGSDGTLSVIGSDIASGASPNAVTIDHADRFAYVANLGESTLSQYKIGLDGVLIPMTTPKVASGVAPAAVVVDPTNRFAYAANFGANSYVPPPGPGTISQYSIAADGSLTPMSVPTVASGNGPNAMIIDPTGKYLYVANLGDNTVSQYTIDAAAGALTANAVPTVVSGKKPVGITIDPSGHYVYVANALDATISQYAIDPASGVLLAMTPATVTLGSGGAVSGVTVDPTGKYLYATIRGGSTIAQLNIGPGGALTLMTQPTVASGLHPTAIATGY